MTDEQWCAANGLSWDDPTMPAGKLVNDIEATLISTAKSFAERDRRATWRDLAKAVAADQLKARHTQAGDRE